MMTRTCSYCGKQYSEGGYKYCSDECKTNSKKEYATKYYRVYNTRRYNEDEEWRVRRNESNKRTNQRRRNNEMQKKAEELIIGIEKLDSMEEKVKLLREACIFRKRK